MKIVTEAEACRKNNFPRLQLLKSFMLLVIGLKLTNQVIQKIIAHRLIP